MKHFFTIFACLFYLTTCCQKTIIVSPSGKEKYNTIQSAFDAIPSGNNKPITILVKKGIYKERLILDTRKNFVSLIGEDKENTIITFSNHAGLKLANGDTVNTWSSATCFIYADDFTAQNITFKNEAGFTAGQAVGLFVQGNRAAFYNCNIIGNQDILFCNGNGTKEYYKNCYIEGTTDFIFGAATALFDSCHIHSKKNSHVTAASTPREIPYGFVFLNCTLTADTGINKVSLGRPWQPNSNVAYLNCFLDKHIIPEGWNNWKNPNNEATARYAEYKNYGPGANTDLRVKWSKQLSDEEAKKYTIKNILGDWNPLFKH